MENIFLYRLFLNRAVFNTCKCITQYYPAPNFIIFNTFKAIITDLQKISTPQESAILAEILENFRIFTDWNDTKTVRGYLWKMYCLGRNNREKRKIHSTDVTL